MKAMRSIAAIVIGYAVMVAGAWFGQESRFPAPNTARRFWSF